MISLPSLELLHQLRLRGTLSGAAHALSLSASAASHRLSVLQREAGTPVVERVGRTLRLTAVGVRLAESAERIMQELEAAQSALQSARESAAGPVSVGMFHAAAMRLLPRVLRDLTVEYPRIALESSHVSADAAFAAVASGDLDLAVAPSHPAHPMRADKRLHTEVLYTEPLYLAVPPGHPLTGSDAPIPLSRLANEHWVAGETFDLVVPGLCAEAGFTPAVTHRSEDYLLLTLLISAGSGISVMPDLGSLLPGSPIDLLRIDAPGLDRDAVVVLRTAGMRRPPVAAVLRLLQRAAADV